MSAAVPSKKKSRRRLARGPRSGDQQLGAVGGGNGATAIVAQSKVGLASNSAAAAAAFLPPSSPHEDHRVVSTHFHDGATQAIMKVTILAAGFVIGARGISARLIGQITGAVVHSWTERTAGTCRSPPPPTPPHHLPPVRLFRIEGKRASVQAAVALIHEAVTKYKELCECKRRGEFVQREHVIGGVEFYYHPPPRRALAPPSPPPPVARKVPPPLPPPPPPVPASSSTCPPPALPASPHAWKNINGSCLPPSQAVPASSQPFLLNFRLQPPAPPPLPENLLGDSSAPPLPPPHLLPNFRSPPGAPPPTQLLARGSSKNSSCCVASVEQSLHRVSNTQENSSKTNLLTEQLVGGAPLKLQYKQHQHYKQHQRQPGGAGGGGNQQVQQYCSLFSVFGNGGLPLPIAQVAVAMAQKDGGAAMNHGAVLQQVSGAQQLQAASTAFEFTACDFLRESLPLPAFRSAPPNRSGAVEVRRPVASAPPQEYCLFGQHRLVQNCSSITSSLQLMPSPATPASPPPPPPPPPSAAPAPASSLINALGAVPDLIQWPPLIRSTRSVLPHDPSKAS